MPRRTRSEIASEGQGGGKEGKEMAAQYGLTIDSVCYALLPMVHCESVAHHRRKVVAHHRTRLVWTGDVRPLESSCLELFR